MRCLMNISMNIPMINAFRRKTKNEQTARNSIAKMEMYYDTNGIVYKRRTHHNETVICLFNARFVVNIFRTLAIVRTRKICNMQTWACACVCLSVCAKEMYSVDCSIVYTYQRNHDSTFFESNYGHHECHRLQWVFRSAPNPISKRHHKKRR